MVGDGESDGDDEPRRPDGGDAAALCAAFGGDPDAVEGLLRGVTPVEDPVFHAESLHAALAAALGLPAATVGSDSARRARRTWGTGRGRPGPPGAAVG